LLFVPQRIVTSLAALVTDHLALLLPPAEAAAPEPTGAPDAPKKAGRAAKRQEKAAAKADVPPDLQEKIARLLADSARTPEIAFYGSMVADAAERNVDAACQVAFAVSVHPAEMGFDAWTGLSDDRNPDQAGADMMGTAPFASGAVFYRHLAVDVDQLVHNLGGDADAKQQGKRALAAFMRASVLAIPTGKQNSTLAQNLPAFALVEVRQGRPRPLNEAFVVPVHPTATEHGGMVDKAILKLGEQFAALDIMYGAKGRRELAFSVVDPAQTLGPAFMSRVPTAKHRTADGDHSAIDTLIEGAVAAAFGTA
jgi:CRISPR system Cascade subunit CasC